MFVQYSGFGDCFTLSVRCDDRKSTTRCRTQLREDIFYVEWRRCCINKSRNQCCRSSV